jgi:hypothetical protein
MNSGEDSSRHFFSNSTAEERGKRIHSYLMEEFGQQRADYYAREFGWPISVASTETPHA